MIKWLLALLVASVTPAKAGMPGCTATSVTPVLYVPNTSASGDQWAACINYDLNFISTATNAGTFFPNTVASSFTVQGANGILTSSITLSGTTGFDLTSSSGIYISGGDIWDPGGCIKLKSGVNCGSAGTGDVTQAGVNNMTGLTNYLAGSTVTYSTTGWTYANSNVSTFTWTGWVLPAGGPDYNVISTTYVVTSTGVFYTNLPSSVPYVLCGQVFLNASTQGPFTLKLATNTVGDIQSDMLQTGSLSNNGTAGSLGSASFQIGCTFITGQVTFQPSSDILTFCAGNSAPILQAPGNPSTSIFDLQFRSFSNTQTVSYYQSQTCSYFGGKSGPKTSPINGIGFYPPGGVQMTGWFQLKRGAQIAGGN